MEIAEKKERKSNIEHSLGARVCVLQRSSAIHFENILLIERITAVVVARGGVCGGSSRPSGRCLCRLYLIGPSFGIFQVRPPFDHEEGLGNSVHAWKPGGGSFMHLCFASIHQLTGRQKDTLPRCSLHAKLQSTTVPADRPSTLILSPPSRCNCHCELSGGPTRRNAMTKDGGEDCRDSWRNPKPRGTKRLEGYLQPTFGSTPQLTLITATLFRQMKVNRIWNFCHHGEIVFG